MLDQIDHRHRAAITYQHVLRGATAKLARINLVYLPVAATVTWQARYLTARNTTTASFTHHKVLTLNFNLFYEVPVLVATNLRMVKSHVPYSLLEGHVTQPSNDSHSD